MVVCTGVLATLQRQQQLVQRQWPVHGLDELDAVPPAATADYTAAAAAAARIYQSGQLQWQWIGIQSGERLNAF